LELPPEENVKKKSVKEDGKMEEEKGINNKLVG
jgi:hypothetical protein